MKISDLQTQLLQTIADEATLPDFGKNAIAVLRDAGAKSAEVRDTVAKRAGGLALLIHTPNDGKVADGLRDAPLTLDLLLAFEVSFNADRNKDGRGADAAEELADFLHLLPVDGNQREKLHVRSFVADLDEGETGTLAVWEIVCELRLHVANKAERINP